MGESVRAYGLRRGLLGIALTRLSRRARRNRARGTRCALLLPAQRRYAGTVCCDTVPSSGPNAFFASCFAKCSMASVPDRGDDGHAQKHAQKAEQRSACDHGNEHLQMLGRPTDCPTTFG